MNITIPTKFSIGDKVYRLIGTDIHTDTVNRIEVHAFNVSKKDITVKPAVRYILDNATGTFYEGDLFKSEQDVLDTIVEKMNRKFEAEAA